MEKFINRELEQLEIISRSNIQIGVLGEYYYYLNFIDNRKRFFKKKWVRVHLYKLDNEEIRLKNKEALVRYVYEDAQIAYVNDFDSRRRKV